MIFIDRCQPSTFNRLPPIKDYGRIESLGAVIRPQHNSYYLSLFYKTGKNRSGGFQHYPLEAFGGRQIHI
jgi:hypothetical protein